MQDGKVPQEILDFISTTILSSPTFKSIQKEAEKHFRKSQAKGQLHPFSHTYSPILKDQFTAQDCPFGIQFLKEQFEWARRVTEKQVAAKSGNSNKNRTNVGTADDF